MLEIYLDVDGVIYSINKHAISIANEEFHTNYNYMDNTSWWWDDYTKETGFANREYFEKLLDRKGFFLNGEAVSGAIKGVNKLHDYGFDIKFITSPHWSSPYMIHERVEWLEKNFDWFKKEKHLVLTSNKKVCDKEDRVLIDDYPHNLNWIDGLNICFSQTYNREYNGLRVEDWNELVKYLIELEKEF